MRTDDTERDVVPLGLSEPAQRNPWVGIVVRTLIAVGVLAAIYAGAAHYLGNRIPNGTSVSGVQIGNLTPEDARSSLERRLASIATDPVKIDADGERYTLDPSTSGLRLDLDATLDDLTGVNYDPRVMWDRLTDDGGEVPLEVSIDRALLEESVGQLAEDIDLDPVEGQVALARGRVVVAEPEDRESAGRGGDSGRDRRQLAHERLGAGRRHSRADRAEPGGDRAVRHHPG